jgi:hypothetical protein
MGMQRDTLSSKRFADNVRRVVAMGGALGGAPDGDGGGSGGSGSSDSGAAEIARLKADNEKYRKEDETRKTADDKRKADEDARRAAEEGKTAELLKRERDEKDALKKRVDEIDKRDSDAAEAIFAKLPKASQSKLEIVKGTLNPAKWLQFVQAEQGTVSGREPDDDGGEPGAIRRGNDSNDKIKGNYKPQHRAEIEERTGKDIQWLDKMRVEQFPDGSKRFGFPSTMKFIQTLKDVAAKGADLTVEEYNKRQQAKR